MHGRERHSQFQRTGEKCESLAKQGVNEYSPNLKYHAHTDRITMLYRYIHTDRIMADTYKTSCYKSFVSLALKVFIP